MGKNITLILLQICPMAQLKTNIDLSSYHTFGLPHKTDALFEYESEKELIHFLKTESRKYKNLMPIGSGSNLLFTKTYHGCLLHNLNQHIKITDKNATHTFVQTGGGLEWDDFVAWTVEHNLYGLENLSLIPGTTGATPVQNIGAYGVEVRLFIKSLEAIEIATGKKYTFSNADCRFGYRDSIFKNEWRNRFVVISVTYQLLNKPQFNVNYGSLKQEIDRLGPLNQENVRKAVINIRNSKLPDPDVTGNAGSFFKNPVVTQAAANNLLRQFPAMPHYPAEDSSVKLAAGWLIDQCGLKGYQTEKGAGIHDKQALVLINKGAQNGADILELARYVQTKVKKQFDIELEPEATIL